MLIRVFARQVYNGNTTMNHLIIVLCAELLSCHPTFKSHNSVIRTFSLFFTSILDESIVYTNQARKTSLLDLVSKAFVGSLKPTISCSFLSLGILEHDIVWTLLLADDGNAAVSPLDRLRYEHETLFHLTPSQPQVVLIGDQHRLKSTATIAVNTLVKLFVSIHSQLL